MPSRNEQRSGDAFIYEIVDGPELLVVGLSARTTNEAEAGPEGVIPGLWRRFRAGKVSPDLLPLHGSHEVLATYTEYESDEHGAFTFTLGYRVTSLDQVPEGLTGAVVPAQLFARIAVEGSPTQSIPAAWKRIWTAFDDEPYSRRFLADAEIYTRNETTGIEPSAILIGVNPW